MKKILIVSSLILVLIINGFDLNGTSINPILNDNENINLIIDDLNAQDIIEIKPSIIIKNVFRLMNSVNYSQAIKYLLGCRLDVNARYKMADNSWATLLMIACQMNEVKLSELLIEHGALLNEKNSEGMTPLIFAMLYGDGDLAELLIKNGAQFNERDPEGNIAFHCAVRNNNEAAIKILIKNGLNITNEIRSFFYAILTRNLPMLELLINYGFNVNSINKDGCKALEFAIFLLWEKGKELLMQEKLLTNTSAASQKLNEEVTEIVELLLKNGADANHNGLMPSVLRAVLFKNKEIAKLLLEYGANPNVIVKGDNNFSLLSLAAAKGDVIAVKWLLDYGADINLPSALATNSLFYAHNVEIAQLLLEKCSDIDYANTIGDTALIWAIYRNEEQLVEFLIIKGADVNFKRQDGTSLLEIAKSNGNGKIIDLLVKYGAK